MTDYDTIWRRQDEIRTVVDAALGCGIWDIRYNSKREAIELELATHLDEDAVSDISCQFPCLVTMMEREREEQSLSFICKIRVKSERQVLHWKCKIEDGGLHTTLHANL